MKASPYKSRPGTWVCKGLDPATGQRRNFYGKSKEEAEGKALASFGPSPIDPEDKSLYAFYSKVYLPTIIGRSSAWQSQIGWAMDGFVMPHFGEWKVEDIKRKDVQSFFNAMKSPAAKSSKDKIRIVLSGVFNLAIMDEIIATNPAANIRVTGTQTKKGTPLTFEELHLLIERVEARTRPAVLLMGACGLRISEALGVTRQAIKNGTLSIEGQVTKAKGGTQTVKRALKTESSSRHIPLPKELESQLTKGKTVFICPGEEGPVLSHQTVAKDIKEAADLSGLPRVSPHDLRRTFISLMENELEAPRPIVQALCGHADKSVTGLYSKSTTAQKLKFMESYVDRVSTACRPKEWSTNEEKLG